MSRARDGPDRPDRRTRSAARRSLVDAGVDPADPARQAGARCSPRSPASGAARPPATISLAARYPDETMIVDELGTLTFGEVHRRTNALAHALSDAGIKEGDGVGIMCRNHRGFIESTVAVSKLGRRRALPQHRLRRARSSTEVVKREKPAAIIYDEEFTGLLADAGKRRKRFVAWHDSEKTDDPDARRPDRERATDERRRRAVTRGPRGDPHLGHHGHAEGRLARQPADARPGRVAAVADPAAQPARRRTSPRRCSTPGASRTTRSA